MSKLWQVRLAEQVELDLQNISVWTSENFGLQQAAAYLETITLAIEALFEGPAILGAKERSEIGPRIFTLHVARLGRKGRHFVVFKISQGQTIDVLRLLHDSMDLASNLEVDRNPPN
jgi:toxin ParE1/3/4